MIKKIFTLFVGITTISSCTIQEEVSITDTGSVDYVQRIEMPQMAALMGAADMDEKIEMNQISNTEYNYIDFLEKMKSFGSTSSTVKSGEFENFALYKDELKAIDFVKFRLDMRDNFAFEVINRAKSVDEFNSNSGIVDNTFADIKIKEEARIAKILAEETPKEKRKRLKKGEELPSAMFGDNPLSNFSSMKYSFDGKSFSKAIDAEKYLKAMKLEEEQSEEDQQIFSGMLKQMKFKYKYTFPRKIKSLDIKDAMFTSDGKSFIKEYSLDEFLKDPKVGEFKVELED